MKRLLLAASLLAMAVIGDPSAVADDANKNSHRNAYRTTIAVIGDWPYNQNLLTNASLLVNSINADRAVSLVMHLGDIHAGGMPCTSAGILPPIPTSDPGWNQAIYSLLQKFEAPVVYTPGDNEWTDCHRTRTGKSGDPLKELASLRSLFFARPGKTLGLQDRDVWSQAQHYDPAYPADAKYVENMIWEDANVVFVTVNMPGSNNDLVPWTNEFANRPLQLKEVAERTAADIRWLKTAFQLAMTKHAKAVVVALQADMWDSFAASPGGDGLNGYTGFVHQLAELSLKFARPVLLLNGDSHVYFTDRPLADPNGTTGVIHKTKAVPNLTRITVQGATTKPGEWLRLTIDTRKAEVFSWTNVEFCADPAGTC